MIENIGASFGTAIIATVVASNLSMRHSHHEMSHSIVGFHEGFLVSMIAIILILIPTYYLGVKQVWMKTNFIHTCYLFILQIDFVFLKKSELVSSVSHRLFQFYHLE